MKIFGLYALLLALVPFAGNAQQGDYFMTHYTPSEMDRSYQIFDMAQDARGVLYAAHRGGILIFDGSHWDNIKMPASVFALEMANNGKLYTGGPQGFHIIERNAHNQWEVSLLHENEFVKDIIEIHIQDSMLYGISNSEVYQLNLETGDVNRFDNDQGEQWSDFVQYDNTVAVVAESGRIYRSENQRLFPEEGKIGNALLRFISENPSGGTYLAATSSNELLLFDGEYHSLLADAVDRRDRAYLMENEIIEGQWLNDTLMVVSTLKGGVLFISPELHNGAKRNVRKIINYQANLPDNQVFNMFVDREQALWINHDHGLTRVDPSSPLRRFDHFPGLEGEIKSAVRFQDKLYVGTTEGLFYLNETPVYEKITTKEEQWVQVDQPTKKGFFKKLFKKETDATASEIIKQSVMRTRNEFHSIKNEFIRVDKIETKTLNFLKANGNLYINGLGGVYRHDGKNVTNLHSEPIQFLFHSAKRQALLGADFDGRVFQIELLGRKNTSKLLHEFSEPINHITEDEKGNRYFIGMHTLYLEKSNQSGVVPIPFNNPHYAQTVGIISGDSVFIASNSFFALVDTREQRVIPREENSVPAAIVSGSNGDLWLSNNGWRLPGEVKKRDNFRHLQILNGIQYLSTDGKTGGRWVITSHGIDEDALYHLAPQKEYGWQTPNELYLLGITSNVASFSPNETLSFGQEHSTITFHIGQPEYSNLVETEYLYRLEGETEEYSDWSALNNNIRFTYLPPGEYSLSIRSRNALGQVDEINNISFEVTSPYWMQPWFYAVEFAIIALMLLLSLRMKATRYQWVSRLLALLTLITIIELIQALAESKFETESSPVFGFIIQVILAFMILPVEEIIRKYIFKGADGKVIDIIKFAKRNRSEEVGLPE